MDRLNGKVAIVTGGGGGIGGATARALAREGAAVLVVHALEAVEVECEQAEGRPARGAAFDLPREVGVEGAVIAKAGEAVGVGGVVEPIDLSRILDRAPEPGEPPGDLDEPPDADGRDEGEVAREELRAERQGQRVTPP